MRARALFTAVFFALALAGKAHAEPVNFKELIPLVSINIPGWTPGTPNGTTVKAPVEASEAALEFTKGDASLEVAIFDGGPALGSATAMASQVDMESTEEVIKSLTIKGFKATLYLNLKEKESDLVIMVPPRFAVTVHLSGASDAELLKSTAAQIDLAKLSTLGK
jgi:hypothetical protein